MKNEWKEEDLKILIFNKLNALGKFSAYSKQTYINKAAQQIQKTFQCTKIDALRILKIYIEKEATKYDR